MNKFEIVREAIIKEFGKDRSKKPRLLDVGCRDCILKKYIGDLVEYSGVDLFQNDEGSVDYVQDFSSGLSVPDGSFDIVVALDLVEHLDDLSAGMEELLRLTNNQLIVLMPNMAHVYFRRKFFLKGTLNAKYDLKYGMGEDRHRWLTVIPQIDDFVTDFSKERRLSHRTVRLVDSLKKRAFMRVASVFGLGPAWWAWASIYDIKKPALIHA